MKIPFDIEKAKNGAKVVTREGKPVRIISYDRKADSRFGFPVIALISDGESESLKSYLINGRRLSSGTSSPNDLFLDVESEYKPFDFSNVPIGRIVVSKRFELRGILVATYENSVAMGVNVYNYTYLLENFTFEDGSPCGVLVS